MNHRPSFCILPWIHASISPSGDVYPCCRVVGHASEAFGNLHQNTLEQIRGNTKFSEFRNMMLNGVSPLVCKDCYIQEDHQISSLRTDFLNQYAELSNSITINDSHDHLPIRYAEVRFSNKCNLTCRTCNGESSSSWHADEQLITFPEKRAPHKKFIYPHPEKGEGLLKEIGAQLDDIDLIYFAGGEPLIQKEHYDLLEKLIASKKTDIILSYNSNLTRLGIGEKSVLKLWKYFKNIKLQASLDAIGKPAELIRPGEQWDVVEKNIKLIRMFVPHAQFEITPTVSVLNALRLSELIEYGFNNSLIHSLKQVILNLLWSPEYYQVNILPEKSKEKVIHDLKFLADKYPDGEGFIKQINFLSQMMRQTKTEQNVTDFKYVTQQLDKARKESTLEILPELSDLLI